jgi:hypothetical protein
MRVKIVIKDVKWNYDAANKDIVFVHIYDEEDKHLTVEIERRRGQRYFNWIVRKRFTFEIRVANG